MSVLRTYMIYPEKIDPAHILTIADLELSTALSSTLVSFGDTRELVTGLAEKWTFPSANKIEFTLRENLHWSDGSNVTAGQYKDALLRAKRLYGADLKALFDSIVNIEAIDQRSLVITTTADVASSGILLKLTEPMYGLVATKSDGQVDLGKTVGPYFVKDQKTFLTLALNKNWINVNQQMPKVIEIKRPPKDKDVLADFENDTWANLVSGNSILNEKTMQSFKDHGFRIWQRTQDRLFALYPSKIFIKRGGNEVLKTLSGSINVDELLKGISGYTLTDQFFTKGYILWSSSGPRKVKAAANSFSGPIKIILPETYYAFSIKERLPKMIKAIIPKAEVSVELVSFANLNARMQAQDYDILATGIAIADPNFEGAVSFFVEREPPFIPSSKAPCDFNEQVRAARSLPKSESRAERMKEIILRAQETGFVLPLFHFSSLSVAKPGVDLSGVPNTDETIHFAKVRMM